MGDFPGSYNSTIAGLDSPCLALLKFHSTRAEVWIEMVKLSHHSDWTYLRGFFPHISESEKTYIPL